MMLTGVVLEGLQDLLVQYLQLKMDFGVRDVVRRLGQKQSNEQTAMQAAWLAAGCSGRLHPHARAWPGHVQVAPPTAPPQLPLSSRPPQSKIFMIFGGCGLLVQTLLLRTLLG